MKNAHLIIAFCLLCLLPRLLTAQSAVKPFNTGLIPTPQKVERSEGQYNCDIDRYNGSTFYSGNYKPKDVRRARKAGKLVIIVHIVDSIEGARNQEQAYRLTIQPEQIDIDVTVPDGAGKHYACSTLRQLYQIWGPHIPCMRITDWPAFTYRGWLDDISRGPIPTTAFLNKERERMKSLKMNFYNLYTEHTFYNPAFPDLCPKDGIHAEDLKDKTSKSPQFLEAMINLQVFAHQEKIFTNPFYESMRDTKHNLNPGTEDTYDYLKTQIDSIISIYDRATSNGTRFFNINCDETEALGSGRAKEYVAFVGEKEAYIRHINRVYDLIRPHNKEVLMWGDIVSKHPEMLEQLPRNMQYIVWAYHNLPGYVQNIAPFKKMHEQYGTKFWVAPGVSHWSSVYPKVDCYIENIANLARDGYQAGACGFMNTAWDDAGESLMSDCWHAMAWGAEMAWHPIEQTEPESAKAEREAREAVFNENFDRLFHQKSEQIHAVGGLIKHPAIQTEWYETKALWEPLMLMDSSKLGPAMAERCKQARLAVNEVLNRVDSSMPHAYYAAKRIQTVVEKNELRLLMYQTLERPTETRVSACKQMMDTYLKHLHELERLYLPLWDEECREYFRENIRERYHKLGKEILEAESYVFIDLEKSADGNILVRLRTLFNDRDIYYTVDGQNPSKSSIKYEGAFEIKQSCIVKAVSFNTWDDAVYTEKYLLFHKGFGHLKSLGNTWHPRYAAGGNEALADGKLGSETTYKDGNWQGFKQSDIDAIWDFKDPTDVNRIEMRFMQRMHDWILAPETAEVYTSTDGKQWKLIRTEHFATDFHKSGIVVNHEYIDKLKLKTRWLRVVIKNPGALPDWHTAKGNPSFLFTDEIVIR